MIHHIIRQIGCVSLIIIIRCFENYTALVHRQWLYTFHCIIGHLTKVVHYLTTEILRLKGLAMDEILAVHVLMIECVCYPVVLHTDHSHFLAYLIDMICVLA